MRRKARAAACDAVGKRLTIHRIGACLNRQRQNPGGITVISAIIGAVDLHICKGRIHPRAVFQTGCSLAEHGVGAGLIAVAGQCSGHLGLCQGRLERVALYIRIVAQIAHGGGAFAGQHHQGIGHSLAPAIHVTIKVRCIVDLIAQVAQGGFEGLIGHSVSGSLGA